MDGWGPGVVEMDGWGPGVVAMDGWGPGVVARPSFEVGLLYSGGIAHVEFLILVAGPYNVRPWDNLRGF